MVITFHSPIAFNPSEEEQKAIDQKQASSEQRDKRIIASLQLDTLQQFLDAHGFQIKSFTAKDIPHPVKDGPSPEEQSYAEDEAWSILVQLEEKLEMLETEAAQLEHACPQNSFSLLRSPHAQPYATPHQRHLLELSNNIEKLEREVEQRQRRLRASYPTGKYLFPPASGRRTLALCCFHCINPTLPPTSARHRLAVATGPTTADTTQGIVSLLNLNLAKLRQDGNIPIVAAMPNWIGSSAPPISFGCPAAPAIPVTGDHPWTNWHVHLPQLTNE